MGQLVDQDDGRRAGERRPPRRDLPDHRLRRAAHERGGRPGVRARERARGARPPAEALREDDDVREFYLGLGGDAADARSYRDVKHYRRRKRWLS